MPKIPLYEGKQKLQPTAAPRAQAVSPHLFEQRGKTMEDFGDALLRIEERTTQVKNLYQVTKASVDSDRQIMEVQGKALQDPDLDTNLPTYREQIRKVADQAGSSISDPIERMKFNSKVSQTITSMDFSLGVEARKVLSGKAKATVEAALDAEKQKVYLAANEPMKQQAIARAQNTALEAIAAGVWDPVKGKEVIDGINDDFRRNDIETRMGIDPESAVKILESGQHGILDPKLVKSLLEDAKKAQEAQVQKGKVQLSGIQGWSEMKIMGDLVGDTLQLNYLNDEWNATNIRTDFRDAVEENYLSSKRYVAQSNPTIFAKLYGNALEGRKEGEVRGDIRERMLETIKANTEGKITVSDMGTIVGIIGAEFQLQDSPDNEGWFRRWRMEADKTERTRQIHDKVFKQFDSWNKARGTGSPDDAVQMTENIMAGVKSGKIAQSKVDEAVNQAISVRKKLDNPTAAQYEVGQILPGNRKVVGFDSDGEVLVEVEVP